MDSLIKKYQEAIRKDNIELQNELRLKIAEEREKLIAKHRGVFEEKLKHRRMLQRKQKAKHSRSITRDLYKQSIELYRDLEKELLIVRQIKKELRESR